MITINVDGIEIKIRRGTKILWAALDNGLYIPNLCAAREAITPFASCRLCFVEIEGRDKPVTACTEPATEGMIVHLNTDKVKRLRNTAFELLLSHHNLDCSNCAKNKNCGFQETAAALKIKLKPVRFRRIPRNLPVDSSHTLFSYDPNKCILCGKCVLACETQGSGILEFAFRGIDTIVGTFSGIPLAEAGCTACLACVGVCPVGALVAKAGVGPIFIPRAGI